MFSHFIDQPGVQSLSFGAALSDDLECGGVQGHQTQVQPREQAGQYHEDYNKDDLDPEGEEGGLDDNCQPRIGTLMHRESLYTVLILK